MVSNSVSFQTTDSLVQAVYNAAEDKARHNLVQFAGRRVLIEGGEYPNLWLETQPMGGEMYAKRDPEAAYNNIDLFMRAANSEGMMPGMISYIDGVYREHHNFIQGYCFPVHALNLYYLLNLDRDYLLRLYEALRRYDAWLWASRESDGDGCLEAWCPCDTGEDYASKFFGAPHFWESRNPPHSHEYHFPRASMDLMGYLTADGLWHRFRCCLGMVRRHTGAHRQRRSNAKSGPTCGGRNGMPALTGTRTAHGWKF